METDSHSFRIRPALPDEADRLTTIAVSAKASWGYPATWIDDWRHELSITADYIQRHLVFAAEFDSVVRGLVSIELDESVAQIGNLWVAPEYHGHGIGRALVAHCIELGRMQGLEALVVESDPHAAGFYRRMGAAQIDALPAPLPGMPDRVLPILRFELD